MGREGESRVTVGRGVENRVDKGRGNVVQVDVESEWAAVIGSKIENLSLVVTLGIEN